MREEEDDSDKPGLQPTWPDQASNPYTDIAVEEERLGLLSSNSSFQSSSYGRFHHHHHEQQHHHHQHQHQPHQFHDQQLVTTSPPITYATQSHITFSGLPETGSVGHFHFGNGAVPERVAHRSSGMRTGEGMREDGGISKRVWKRRRAMPGEEAVQQNKMDPSQRCDVCGEQASGHYFGALVCLPCKSFFIRCTKDGRPKFTNQCGGKCDVLKGGRVRCQHCRFQKCINAGMYRKEKPEAVEPAEGQLLCKVCGDIANGVHFGVTTCEGCKKFFRRGQKENKTYNCKGGMRCSINPRVRNNCRYCRYRKCLYEGMSREAIKMGRPKKGEVPYRKPSKKTGIKPSVRSVYGSRMTDTNRLPVSCELDRDEISTSDSAYNHATAMRHHQMQSNNSQLNNHLHHPLHHQPQQQPTPVTFSLGSILHDSMTVNDWEQKVEMGELDQDGHLASSSSSVIVTSEGNSVSMMEEGRQVGQMRHTSPIIIPDVLGRHCHQHEQLQYIKIVDNVQSNLQPLHQSLRYREHNSINGSIIGSRDMGFSNEHELQANRPIKEEIVSIHDGSRKMFTEGAMLEDVQNLQTITKDEFRGYHLQNFVPNSPYCMADRTATSTPSSGGTVVPTSHLDLEHTGSKVVAINLSSQSVLYTPHSHQEPIIIHNVPHHQPIIDDLTQARHGLTRTNIDHESADADSNLVQNCEAEMKNALSPDGTHRMVASLNTSMPLQETHNLVSHSSVHGFSMTSVNVFNNLPQYFCSDNANVLRDNIATIVSDSIGPKNLNSLTEDTLTVLSFGSQNIATSVPSSMASLTQMSISSDNRISGLKNPLSVPQQQRKLGQAGKPVHLSPQDVEELFNTVSSERQRAQRVPICDQINNNEQKDIVDKRLNLSRPLVDSFLENGHHQHDEACDYNRLSCPCSTRSHHDISHSTQYPSQEIIHELERQYYNSSSVSSDSSSSYSTDTQEPNTAHNLHTNNNGQDGRYLTQHFSPNSQTGQQDEVFDASFNSILLQDAKMLHEINRIFLGVDNSCDTYGCNRQDCALTDIKFDNGFIVSCMSPDEFLPEISHRYWHGFQPSQEFMVMTPDREKIIQDVLDAFDSLQKTYMTSDPEYGNKKIAPDQIEHWHYIQRKIARHVVAGQRFCRNIPGYFRLDIQDRISLGKHVGFGLMVLIACTEFYDSEYKRFKHIWNWTMPMQNPLFTYKIHLLSLGERINDIHVDRIEAALICAVSMTSIDCPGLLNPEIVCVVRDALVDALKAYISSKSEPASRLRKLLNIMPQVRLMTMWYNSLMKKMSLPSDIITNKRCKLEQREDYTVNCSSNFS